MMKRNLTLPTFLFALLLGGCAAVLPIPTSQPVCPPCAPSVEPEKPKPTAKPLQAAEWADLPGWESDDHAVVLDLFRQQCTSLAKRPLWLATCEAAQKVGVGGTARAWFEAQFRPWVLVNPDDKREGMVTGYYEPIVRGSRNQKPPYAVPVFGPPEDMIVVDLGELYPELKHMRLRGKLDGRKLVPYFSRAEWSTEELRRSQQALLWLDDPIDFFFLQIQGSGQVALDDGSRVRIGYADQNGHPYRSIGRWLIDQGELKSHEASMQGIKAWAAANPRRLQELLNTNPSLVFFRELPVTGNGPPGALGIPLTPERSIAVDPRHTPLGAPVWLATTRPNSDESLQRLMLAQDTGGAIRGPVRADFYWGSGAAPGAQAGKMKQSGQMWVLLPRWHTP
ncbi:MAG: MltA domain-containing protein [Rhodocyclaceae bacterium]|nr:MltA domain-containing protein [Rhodocyclaceae bacterium]MDZ4216173.1 MltA domain-containing protein [Rhodocyclaceae bacterium]